MGILGTLFGRGTGGYGASRQPWDERVPIGGMNSPGTVTYGLGAPMPRPLDPPPPIPAPRPISASQPIAASEYDDSPLTPNSTDLSPGYSQSGSTPQPNDRLQQLFQDPRAMPKERGLWRQVGAGLVRGVVSGFANGVFSPIADELGGRLEYGSKPWKDFEDWKRETGLAAKAEDIDRRRDQIEYQKQYRDYVNQLKLSQEQERARQNDIREEGRQDRRFGRQVDAYNNQLRTLGPKSWEDPGELRLSVPTPGASGVSKVDYSGVPVDTGVPTFTAPQVTAGGGFADVPDSLGGYTLPAGGMYIPPGSTRTTLPQVKTPEGDEYLPQRNLITPPPGWENRDRIESRKVIDPQAAGELGLDPQTPLSEAQIREARDLATRGRFSERGVMAGSRGGTQILPDGTRNVIPPVPGSGPVSRSGSKSSAPKPPDPYKYLDRKVRADQARDRAISQANADFTQAKITPAERDRRIKQAGDSYSETIRGLDQILQGSGMIQEVPKVPGGTGPSTSRAPSIPESVPPGQAQKTESEWRDIATKSAPNITPEQLNRYLAIKRSKGLIKQ